MVEYLLATDEQKELAELARKVMEKHLNNRIEELEYGDGGLGVFPRDIIGPMAEAGYYGMNIPEEWGGLGLNKVTQALIVEEMSKVDVGCAFTIYNSGALFPLILLTGMPRDEKQSWADRILSGDVMGCFALTESDAGSDAAAMRSTAFKDKGDWVINGTKCFISAAPNADFFLVAAWTDKSQKARNGVTLFFIEKERGVQVGKKENKMGLKLSETAEVILDNVRVPEDHVIGGVGNGLGMAMNLLNEDGRIYDAVCCLGLAQAALDQAVEYAKIRRQFGKRIIDHEGLGFLIADMQTRTDASRALLYQTVEAMERGIHTRHMTSAVKMYVTDCAMQTTTDAVQVLGGYGYMKEYPVEKYMRDAKIFQIFGGTNQIQRKIIAKTLAGNDPEVKKA